MSRLPYRGYFINLERSSSRRERLELQLSRFMPGQHYERFAAVDGSTLAPRGPLPLGALGCFHSHVQLLEAAREEDTHLHVLEDDACLCDASLQAVARLTQSNVLDSFDLVFTDVFVPLDLHQAGFYYRLYESTRRQSAGETWSRRIHLIDLKHRPWACTTSFFVSRRSVGRIASLLRDMLQQGPALAVDLALRNLVDAGQLRAAVLFPFVTSIDLASDLESTIHGPDGANARSRLACSLLRHLFFVAPDENLVRALIREHLQTPERGFQEEALSALLRYAVCGDFNAY